MRAEDLLRTLDSDFYIGVPDSKLRALCDCLMDRYGIDDAHHLIAANEGNCAAIAAGHFLATGKVPVVYMQNSGIGNVINPAVSLLSEKVYGIPVIFVIGWRGEPGINDEPQHRWQGEITMPLLSDVGIRTIEISKETDVDDVVRLLGDRDELISSGRSIALVVREGALEYERSSYCNYMSMTRESAIRIIIELAGEDLIVSTTGKASRELFALREEARGCHCRDFLTVGSMGHSSSIALGIAIARQDKRVWCIDGDGAALMHMGAMAVIGATSPKNLVHAVINNGAHESVGGMPTVMSKIDLCAVARGCGYSYAESASDETTLRQIISAAAQKDGPCFIEALCGIGSREGLGRPTKSPLEMRIEFMREIAEPIPSPSL